jgi:hypothetical protein
VGDAGVGDDAEAGAGEGLEADGGGGPAGAEEGGEGAAGDVGVAPVEDIEGAGESPVVVLREGRGGADEAAAEGVGRAARGGAGGEVEGGGAEGDGDGVEVPPRGGPGAGGGGGAEGEGVVGEAGHGISLRGTVGGSVVADTTVRGRCVLRKPHETTERPRRVPESRELDVLLSDRHCPCQIFKMLTGALVPGWKEEKCCRSFGGLLWVKCRTESNVQGLHMAIPPGSRGASEAEGIGGEGAATKDTQVALVRTLRIVSWRNSVVRPIEPISAPLSDIPGHIKATRWAGIQWKCPWGSAGLPE